MKKFWCVLGLFLFLPLIVFADGVENYYINATVESDGSLLVEEYFTLSGTYRGYERIIDYKNQNAAIFNMYANSYGGSTVHNGTGIELLAVGGADLSFSGNFDNLNIDEFSYDEDASKGDYGVYNYDTTATGKDIMIYNPSRKNKAFYLKYRINNMAVLFTDVGEIGWNVVGIAFREDIDNLVVTLNIPGNDSDLRAWAHGPLNGFIKINSNEQATFTITNLTSYTSIDIRSTFSPSVISNSTKKYNTAALDKILNYENQKAEEANEQRRQNEANNEKLALEYLNNFKNSITRENYTKAYNAINILMDEELKNNYLNELATYKEKLDVIEEEYAEECLKSLEKNLNLDNYDKTLAAIDILDNADKKQEFQGRLDTLYVKLVKKEKTNNNIRIGIACTLIAYVGYLGNIIYKKYKKDPEVEFNNEYFREIPDDATPEDVSYLFDKNISEKAMSASIMDLIRRKVIVQEKIDNKNYNLRLQGNTSELSNKDQQLIALIFNGKTEITTKEMKRNARTNYTSVVNNYNSYKRVAEQDAKREEYYENDIGTANKDLTDSDLKEFVIIFVAIILAFTGIFLPLVIIGALIYLIVKFVKSFKNDASKGIITSNLLVIGLVSFIMSIYISFANIMFKSAIYAYLVLLLIVICVGVWYAIPSKKTYKGALAYKKWKALEKFLKDFGSFADKEVPEITLWEKYLVFATLFGCAKEVSKVMDMKFAEYNMTGLDYYDSWANSYYINDLICNSVRTSVASAKSAKYASEASSSSGSWSSGSGGGGGFSSGGGSFGGGGGGGRF